eukprot:3459392-Pyramimonas_sp.AAC.1
MAPHPKRTPARGSLRQDRERPLRARPDGEQRAERLHPMTAGGALGAWHFRRSVRAFCPGRPHSLCCVP